MGARELSRERELPAWMPAGVAFGTTWLALLARTWRLERRAWPEEAPPFDPDARCIFAYWHSRLLPLVWTHHGRGIGILVSQHRDGEWIARISERLGYQVARGSSTRGGEEGLRSMLSFAEKGRSLGITPDGPRGPARQVKLGTVVLASASGLPIIPITSSARRSWVFRSWDRFRMPQPFARVIAAVGSPIHVPRDLDAAARESWRLKIERAMNDLTDQADALAGSPA